MKKFLSAAALAVALTIPSGCALVGNPTAPPKITNASNAWAAAKIGYGSTFQVFRAYVFTLCPPTEEQLSDETTSIQCPEDLTDAERKIIQEGQIVHAEATELMKTGDQLADGDLTPLVARLSELVVLLNRRATS